MPTTPTGALRAAIIADDAGATVARAGEVPDGTAVPHWTLTGPLSTLPALAGDASRLKWESSLQADYWHAKATAPDAAIRSLATYLDANRVTLDDGTVLRMVVVDWVQVPPTPDEEDAGIGHASVTIRATEVGSA